MLTLSNEGVEGTLVVVAVLTYLVGIISSSVALCDANNESFRVCSVIYAGVGALDMVPLYAW